MVMISICFIDNEIIIIVTLSFALKQHRLILPMSLSIWSVLDCSENQVSLMAEHEWPPVYDTKSSYLLLTHKSNFVFFHFFTLLCLLFQGEYKCQMADKNFRVS